jgi:glycosyltransferase involved in cell wall biosynthesis
MPLNNEQKGEKPPLVSILIPNYNRPFELSKLLKSVFAAIDHAAATDQIEVLVVDDHSTANLAGAISEFRRRPNFRFAKQSERCGNAERAALSAVAMCAGEYVWLVGNDDLFALDAIDYVLPYLNDSRPGFVLLNPVMLGSDGRVFMPITATHEAVQYDTAASLFDDFGFVTSTTTFSCQIFRKSPVALFHADHNLCDISSVYSHTFTFYCALHSQPAIFLSRPVVRFTLTMPNDEMEKLRRQAPAHMPFYHQSLGLIRLISASAKIGAASLATLGRALEDEIDRINYVALCTPLRYFVAHFFINQLIDENMRLASGEANSCLLDSEIKEFEAVFSGFEDDALLQSLYQVLGVHESLNLVPGAKISLLVHVRDRLLLQSRKAYIDTLVFVRHTRILKIYYHNPATFPLRGRQLVI